MAASKSEYSPRLLSAQKCFSQELAKRMRYNCVGVDVAYVTDPSEELQIGDCPSLREFNFRWHYVYQECGFADQGFGEEDEWKVGGAAQNRNYRTRSSHAIYKHLVLYK